MKHIAFATLLTLGTLAADEIVLRNGAIVEGTYLGSDSRSARMSVGGRIRNIPLQDVANIRMGAPGGGIRALTRLENETTSNGVAPEGSELVVRLVDPVDSSKDRAGRRYRASVDAPLVVNGATVVPKGADVMLKLVDDRRSGRLTGRTEMTLVADTITVDGRQHRLTTSEVAQRSGSRTNATAKTAIGLAGLGAVVGALAGGGKGAAIGAMSGAGAGAAVQVMTRGARVRIPTETRLVFTLQEPLEIR